MPITPAAIKARVVGSGIAEWWSGVAGQLGLQQRWYGIPT
jgi:hypothetical protein